MVLGDSVCVTQMTLDVPPKGGDGRATSPQWWGFAVFDWYACGRSDSGLSYKAMKVMGRTANDILSISTKTAN